MQVIEWRFILIILTFLIIGIVCGIRKFKAGVIAAITGVIATVLAWCFRVINLKIKSFFTGIGWNMKEILGFVMCILITIIVFFILAIIIDTLSRRHRRR